MRCSSSFVVTTAEHDIGNVYSEGCEVRMDIWLKSSKIKRKIFFKTQKIQNLIKNSKILNLSKKLKFKQKLI